MKFLVAILIFLTISSCVYGLEIDMKAIAQIESSNGKYKYNKHSGATGKWQITEVCLADYRQFHKKSMLNMKSMYNDKDCYKVAYWYFHVRIPQLLKHYGLDPENLDLVLSAYNAGIKYCFPQYKYRIPKETQNYIQKYKRLAK